MGDLKNTPSESGFICFWIIVVVFVVIVVWLNRKRTPNKDTTRFDRMQPPPLLDTQKVSYQVPRNVLIGIWWRRMMLRPRSLVFSGFLLVFPMQCFFMWPATWPVGAFFLLLLVFIPIAQYRALAKAVDNDQMWTDPRTLEFSASQVVLTGPDWKTETSWKRYKGFSEDATYFYLHLSDNGIASVIPKSAFSPDQQQKFRQYAQTRKA